jgi:hypothetical protein
MSHILPDYKLSLGERLSSLALAILLVLLVGLLIWQTSAVKKVVHQVAVPQIEEKKSHWFVLKRKSQEELLFYGNPGDVKNSDFIKSFNVKTGVPGKKPTPIPQLAGREYWVITQKHETFDSLETAPYFLTLDVPVSEEPPYGPVPYPECEGECDWEIPGAFGLHGIAGDETRLSLENEGSSGCIRHTDEDITYLYNLLNPAKDEIRYYVEDV